MKTSIKGTVFVVLSSIFFGSYGVWSKLMSDSFSIYSQAWVRGIILLILLVPFGIFTKGFKRVGKKDIIWFAIISLCCLNQAPYFYGFQHLSIGTATLLFYLMLTLSNYIIGPLFFKENLTIMKYLSFLIALIGLLIIYKFALTPEQTLPAIATLIAGAMGGIEVAFSKKISSKYSEVQLLVSVFIFMTLGNFVLSIFWGNYLPNIHNYIPWLGELGYVITMLSAVASVFVGFKYLEPSVGSIIGLLEVVFAALFGIIFFKEILSLQLIIGAILILLAAGLSDGIEIIKSHTKFIN